MTEQQQSLNKKEASDLCLSRKHRDFPSNPVVKSSPYMQEVQVRSLVRELRSHISQARKPTHKTEATL